jgi:signal transduction histidine kinase
MDQLVPPAAAGLQRAHPTARTPSFDLQQMLGDLAELYRAAAHGSPVELHFDRDAALPRFLLGDGKRLQQLLARLGSQAIRTCTQGQITLAVEVERMTAAEVSLIFSLRDGDPSDSLFNSCQCRWACACSTKAGQQGALSAGKQRPAALTVAQRFGGTSQGLSYCMRLVKALGGELELLNPPHGPGHCQLSLCLPVAPRVNAPVDYRQ